MERYEQRGEWAGFTVHEAGTGWVIEFWSAQQGQLTGQKLLLPYGFQDLQKGQDLAVNALNLSPIPNVAVGYHLALVAQQGAGGARMLRHGRKVE